MIDGNTWRKDVYKNDKTETVNILCRNFFYTSTLSPWLFYREVSRGRSPICQWQVAHISQVAPWRAHYVGGWAYCHTKWRYPHWCHQNGNEKNTTNIFKKRGQTCPYYHLKWTRTKTDRHCGLFLGPLHNTTLSNFEWVTRNIHKNALSLFNF